MATDRNKNLVLGTLVMLVSVALALGLTLGVETIGVHLPLAFFFASVAVSTWFGGRQVGVSSIVIGGACIAVLVLPRFNPDASLTESSILIGFYFFIAVITLLLFSGYRGTATALTEEEDRLRALVESNPLVIMQLDPDTWKFLWVNQSAVELYGYTREEFLCMSVRDIRHPEDDEELSARMAEIGSEGKGQFVARHLTKDGRTINVEVFSHDVEHKGRKIREVMAVDLTQKLKAEKAARDLDERLEKFVDNNPLAIFQVDPSTLKFIWVNQAATDLYGYSKDEFLGLSLFDIRTHGSESEVRLHVATTEAEGRGHFFVKHTTRDGRLLDVEIFAHAIDHEGRRLQEALVVDITEKVKAVADAADAEVRLGTVVDNLDEGLVIFERTGKVIHANEAALRLIGFSKLDDFDGVDQDRSHVELFDADGKLIPNEQWPSARLLRGETIKDFLVRLRLGDDAESSRTLIHSGNTISDENGDIRYAVIRFTDVTDQIKAQDELRESREQLDGIINSAMDAIISIDADRRIIVFNISAEKMFLRPADEVLGQSLDILIPDRLQEIHRSHVDEFAMSGDPTRHYYDRSRPILGVRSNGEEFQIEASLSSVYSKGKTYHTAILRDISESVKANRALVEANTVYNDLVENSHDMIYSHTLDGKILSMNQYGSDLSGYSIDELKSKSMVDLVTPDSTERALKLIGEMLEGKTPADCRMTMITKDGRHRDLDSNVWLIYEDGKPTGIRGIARDVTSKHQAMLELRRSEERYRSLVENAQDIICTMKLNGTFTSINSFGKSLLGYPEEEFVGRQFASLMTPESAELARVLLWGKDIDLTNRSFELTALAKDGSEKILDVKTWLIYENGQPVSVQGIGRDITLQKRATDELKRSEERYRTLVENAQDVVFTTDLDQNLTSVNAFGCALSGYSLDELISQNLSVILKAESIDHARTMIEAKLAGEETTSYELEITAKDGSKYVLDVKSWLIYENGKPIGSQGIARDITIQRNALTDLRRSEERYRTLVENAQDIIYAHDFEGNFTAANQYAAEITGYSMEQLGSFNLKDIVSPEYLSTSLMLAEKHAAGERVPPHQVDIVTKDGRRVPVSIKSWTNEVDGVPTGVEGIARDITLQVEAVEQLRRSEERYRALVENARDFIYSHDLSGIITSVNAYAAEVAGMTVEELVGKSLFDLVAPEQREIARENIEKRLRGDSVKSHALDLVRPDGFRISVNVKSWPVFKDGRPVGIEGIARDITSEQAILSALEASENRYRTLIENAQDMVFAHDFEGNYTAINDFGAAIIGLTADELIGTNIANQLSPEDLARVKEYDRQLLAGEPVPDHMIEITGLNGKRYVVSVKKWLDIQNGIPIGVQGIARDVTESVRLEERLRVAQKLESIGTLAGGIAHDFNNLMTIVTGYSELALRNIEEDDPNRSKLELIKETGSKAAELTHQLLAFSRKQMLQPEIIDLNSSVENMKKLLKRLLPENIVLKARLEPGVRPILADPGQIEQVILNLAVHARDQMPNGGTLTIATRRVEDAANLEKWSEISAKGPYTLLSITDTGDGLSNEVAQKIFDPYFSTEGIGRGSGLGLATVHGVVKQSGGEIFVTSGTGIGTTFDLLFPVAAEIERTPSSDEANTQSESAGGEWIFVVEDNEMVRPVVIGMLESFGYKTISAESGQEAIAICRARTEPIDLLLTDVIMPGISGRELMDAMRALRPEIKGLFMSGYTDDIVFADGVVDPNSAFIGKPFSAAKLNAKIREILDAHTPPEPQT